MKKTIALLIFTALLMSLIPLSALAYELDINKIAVFKSSNGDGYTPFDLKWEDGAKGKISFGVQSPDLGSDYGYVIVLFHNGMDVAVTGAGGMQETKRAQESLAEFMQSPGEYVFVVYACKNDEITPTGKESKSEPFILGEQGIEKNDPAISLNVELRSSRQAIIKLKDERITELIQKSKETNNEYSSAWTLRFGNEGKYRLRVETVYSPGDLNNNIHFIFEVGKPPYGWSSPSDEWTPVDWFKPTLAASRPIKVEDSYYRALIEGSSAQTYNNDRDNMILQAENTFVFEISMPNMPECEDLDFTKITQYDFEYSAREGALGLNDELIEKTIEVVPDMRNFGQVYDIHIFKFYGGFFRSNLNIPLFEQYKPYDLAQYLRGITKEQADKLYFSPPQSRYVTAQATVERIYPSADGSLKPYKVEVYELVCYDENGNITQITEKLVAANNIDGENAINDILNEAFYYEGEFYGTAKVLLGDERPDKTDEFIVYLRASQDDYYVMLKDGVLAPPYMALLNQTGIRNIDAYIEKAMKSTELGWNWPYTNIVKHD